MSVEPHVFESKTRPGSWFFLAPDGRSGWAGSEADARFEAGLAPVTDTPMNETASV